MAKIDELHNYAYPDKSLDELHRYDKSLAGNSSGWDDEIHYYGNRGLTYGLDEMHLYGSYQTVEIDEINKPQDKTYEVIDIEQYFDEMELDEEQKEERKQLAYDIKFVIALLLLLIQSDIRAGNSVDEDFYVDLGLQRIMDAVEVYITLTIDIETKIRNYVNINLGQIVDSTVRNADQPYFFSEARSTSIACDDSNALFGIEEYEEAIKAGMKYKTWVTMRDNKVRHSHVIADGQTVGIRDSFTVGRCKMAMPLVFDEESEFKDDKEVIRCRCVCQFSKKK